MLGVAGMEQTTVKRYYCTYFDRNYLVKALALFESLNEHEENEFEVFAICMDEITRVILTALAIPNVTPIPMHLIEERDFPLLATKQDRSIVEYYWTATPSIILRILERHPEIEILTYIDSDLYFYSSPTPIFDELGNRSVLIHGHRFPPRLLHLEEYGKYNVGLLCFRQNDAALEVLHWWRDRCIEWCSGYPEGGKFGDQAYLNDWPARFGQVAVLENIGAGVGPWNQEQYSYRIGDDGGVLVQEIPLIFYHFHSLAFCNPDVVVPAKILDYKLREEIIRLCFLPYFHALSRSIRSVRSIMPDFYFGLSTQNLLGNGHTFAARRSLSDELGKIEMRQVPVKLDEEWDIYCSDQMLDYQNLKNLYGISSKQHLNADPISYPGQGSEGRKAAPCGEPAERWGDSAAFVDLGVRYYRQHRFKEALEQLRKAIEINPDVVEAWVTLGLIARRLKVQGTLQMACERVRALDPSHPMLVELLNGPTEG
jgi:tetratricopeptide (TPR) repeat protein